MPKTEPLTETQRDILLSILSRYVTQIDRVDLFGSRARGTHRPGSDVDLLIDGSMTWRELGRLAQDLEDSQLSLFVEVKLKSDLQDDTFARTILAETRPLFSRDDLAMAAA